MQYALNLFKADRRHGIFAQATQTGRLGDLHDHLADSARPARWHFFGEGQSPVERELYADAQLCATHQALEAILRLNVLRRGIARDFEDLCKQTAKGSMKLKLDGILHYLDPRNGRGATFLEFLLSFPRFEDGNRIVPGGLPYLDIESCKAFNWPKEYADTMPPALKHLIDGAPGNLLDAITDPSKKILVAHRLDRLMFDETVFDFKNYVLSVARAAGKDPLRAATRFASALDRLVGGLEALGIDAIQRIDELLDKVLDAMSTLREELAASTNESENGIALHRELVEQLEEIQSQQSEMRCDVSFLVDDVKTRRIKNMNRGKKNQEGDTDSPEHKKRKSAQAKIDLAITKVRNLVMKEGMKILPACRRVCKKFEPISAKKNELGEMEYLHLENLKGEPMKAKTLSRYYRERFNKKKSAKRQ